jgi:hypothetical protein
LSTGEGLIHAVRDPAGDDPGVSDKRLLVVEPEFARPLRVARRDGNILPDVLRQAWDKGNLSKMTSTNPAKATGAHISIIGHITQYELLDQVKKVDAHNGYLNRVLWAYVKRSKLLPDGGGDVHTSALVERLRACLAKAQGVERMTRDAHAAEMWNAIYPRLTADKPGLFGVVTGRAEAQVLRLSMLYALLDGSSVIGVEHLKAALALWRYCEQSCRYIFGDSFGDPVVDRVWEAIQMHPDGITKTGIFKHLNNNCTGRKIANALATLTEYNMVRSEPRPGSSGKPATFWLPVVHRDGLG